MIERQDVLQADRADGAFTRFKTDSEGRLRITGDQLLDCLRDLIAATQQNNSLLMAISLQLTAITNVQIDQKGDLCQ